MGVGANGHMVIYKILNNNLILSKDDQGHEVIVKGCGIAFQKKKGQQIDETLIEKVFTAETAQISKEIQGYLTSIPETYLDFVENYVNEVKEKEGLNLNDSIYFSLSDHIMGAISRLKQGIRIQNMLLLDIKQLYHKEYGIGLELLKRVNETFAVDLAVDEAGFFALHFVNAEDGGKTDGYQISIIVHQILDVVEKYYDSITFQEENLYYQRFLTHLKYFAQRFLHKELHYEENQELFQIIKEQYKEAYGCVKLIYLMMEEEYQYEMTEDEMLYLTIHIQKITEDHKRLQSPVGEEVWC